jgi:hypothetical protein
MVFIRLDCVGLRFARHWSSKLALNVVFRRDPKRALDACRSNSCIHAVVTQPTRPFAIASKDLINHNVPHDPHTERSSLYSSPAKRRYWSSKLALKVVFGRDPKRALDACRSNSCIRAVVTQLTRPFAIASKDLANHNVPHDPHAERSSLYSSPARRRYWSSKLALNVVFGRDPKRALDS